jgi:hypothetical protein
MLVEMRQFPGATCSRAAPSKTRDLHACQYHHHQGSAHQHPKMRILFSRIAGGLAARNQKARSGVGQSRGRRSLSLSPISVVRPILRGDRDMDQALGCHRLRRPRPRRLGRTGVEKPVHGLCAGRQDRPQFAPVNHLGGPSARVPRYPCDLLHGDS